MIEMIEMIPIENGILESYGGLVETITFMVFIFLFSAGSFIFKKMFGDD